MKQLFGSVTYLLDEKPEYVAMLCADSDQSNFATIHYWNETESARAVTFEFIQRGPNAYDLKPVTVYRVNDGDGLYAPNLSDEEKALVRDLKVSLTYEESLSGYRGNWELREERGFIHLVGDAHITKNSSLQPKVCRSWDEFKAWATSLRRDLPGCAFRGHGSNEWKLTTTISRAGRTRLERYTNETIHQFRLHAEVALGREFDLGNPNEYSTLLGLAQHHGLPTPLLDITDSPYVAAYFAFSDAVENNRPSESFVRVYAISGEYLAPRTSSSISIATGQPYIKPLTVSPRHNPRLYVQQGRFLVTNLVDVESFLIMEGQAANKPCLIAADIPTSCAWEALQDLKYMGLTAGSLFPGLDGVSRMIKQMMIVSDTKHRLELLPHSEFSSSNDKTNDGNVAK
jgi:hypothetical protein